MVVGHCDEGVGAPGRPPHGVLDAMSLAGRGSPAGSARRAVGCGVVALLAAGLLGASSWGYRDQPAGTPATTQRPSAQPMTATALPRRPALVIAHRGASAYYPENTLASYRAAIDMGADYIEADLVVTRDDQLIARHENDLSQTTDILSHPDLAGLGPRETSAGGLRATGWLAENYTLAQIRTLRATTRHRSGTRATDTSGTERVPTAAEIIALAREQGARRGRPVGVYLELKDPQYLREQGHPTEPLLAEALRAAAVPDRWTDVMVESFDGASLARFHQLVDVPLIQLYGNCSPQDPALDDPALQEIRGYAAGIGLERSTLAGPSGVPEQTGRQVVERAHRHGLEVHVYTFDNRTVPHAVAGTGGAPSDPPGWSRPLAEYRGYLAAGVDGMFSNNPDTAALALTGR